MCGVTITVIVLALYLMFPQYYSMMSDKMYRNAGFKNGVKRLHIAFMFPILGVAFSSFYAFTIRNWLAMWIWAVLICVLLTVLLHHFSREMREVGELVVVVALFFLLGGYGLAVNANHLLNFSPSEPQSYVVTEKEHRRNRKGPDDYECIITLEDGSELELDVQAKIYREVEVGDEILVYVGKGALGVEYAYFVDFAE